MPFMLIAIISHLITGVANVIDKVVVAKYLKAPSIYAFYVGILTLLSLVLIPFGVVWPGFPQFVMSIIFGIFFVAGFYLMNAGLLRGETSRVITILGGSLPIFTFILSFIFLAERLSNQQLLAVIVLVAGIITMGWEKKHHDEPTLITNVVKSLGHKYVVYSLSAAFFFAASFVGSKFVYDHQPFISGFFWMRMGGVLAGLLMLLNPVWRREIIDDLKTPVKEQKTAKGLILINQTVGAAGFILLNIAISRGSATIVNALQGVQYGFIFILALMLGNKIPQLKEELTSAIIIQKAIAILLIGIGLAILSF